MNVKHLISCAALCVYSMAHSHVIHDFECHSEHKPNIQYWQTKNGVPVYFVERSEIPILDVAFVFDAGSARDPQNHDGLAAATLLLLKEDSTRHTAQELAETLDAQGTVLETEINRDMAIVSMRTTRNALKPSLSVVREIISTPAFSEKNATHIRLNVVNQIRENAQIPMHVALDALYHELYPHHPYGHPIFGTEQSIQRMTALNMKHFYRTYYVAQNAQLILVGAVNRLEAHRIAEDLASALPIGTRAPALPVQTACTTPKRVHVTTSSTQTSFIIGAIGIRPQDPYYWDWLIANHILGGGSSFNAVLFKNIRDQSGLTYSIHSSFLPLSGKGPFFIAWTTRADQAHRALQDTLSIVSRYLKDGPTWESVQEAKIIFCHRLIFATATNKDLLSEMVYLAFYHFPLNYWDMYEQKIQHIQKSTLRRGMLNSIDPRHLIVVEAGP